MNDDEQTADPADWYHPEWPCWRRWLYWNVFRNPLQNFRAYVVGASDKNYWVRGREPVMTVQRNDLVPPEYGYQWCVLYGGELWVPRLFLSYSGKSFVWYVGHQPSGFWGVKFNFRPFRCRFIVSAIGSAYDDSGASNLRRENSRDILGNELGRALSEVQAPVLRGQ